MALVSFSSKISNMKKIEECFIRFSNRDVGCLSTFEVFGNRMKQCLISQLKPLTILGEIQSRSLPDFQIIKITFANLLRGSE